MNRTINIKSGTIKEICDEIERQSDYRFVYAGNTNEIINKQVDLGVNNESIIEILDKLMSLANLSYKILDNQIVVFLEEDQKPDKNKENAERQVFNTPYSLYRLSRVFN